MTRNDLQSSLVVSSPLGALLVVSGPNGLLRCEIGVSCATRCESLSATPDLQRAAEQLSAYFRGDLQEFTINVDLLQLSTFSKTVLTALRRVPYGSTVTYGELAASAGFNNAARAVGRVMANNPLPIIIPCHRVIGYNGSLTGYTGQGGITTKAWLLQHERKTLHGCHNNPHQC